MLALSVVAGVALLADVAQFVFLDTLIATSGAAESRTLLAQSDRLQLVLDSALLGVAIPATVLFVRWITAIPDPRPGQRGLWFFYAASILAFCAAAVLGHTPLLEDLGVGLVQRSVLGAGLEIAGTVLSLAFGVLAFGAVGERPEAERDTRATARSAATCTPLATSYR